jgi:GNAT superfamily N-acetyltransferase
MVLTAFSEGVTGTIEVKARMDLADHPRVQSSAVYRNNLEVFSDTNERGLLIISNGLAGRREVAVEVEPEHRSAGVGRALAHAARSLCRPGEPLFAQVSPGNAASVRAYLAAGFRPICAEVLLLRAHETDLA